MKKLLSLIMGLCLLLCGCGQNQDSTDLSGTEAGSSEPETVTIYVLVSQQDQYIFGENTQTVNYKYTLDENGRAVSCVYTDESGKVMVNLTMEYDDNGLLCKQTAVSENEESVLTTTYDEQGRIIGTETTIDGEARVRITYTYGDTDQPLTMETVAYATDYSNRYEYTYEGERKVKEVHYINGELSSTILYEYDDQGRTSKAVKQQPDGNVEYESTFTYSADGLTCTVKNPAQTQIEVRDGNGNLISKTVEGQGFKQIHTYEYKAVEVPADDPRVK